MDCFKRYPRSLRRSRWKQTLERISQKKPPPKLWLGDYICTQVLLLFPRRWSLSSVSVYLFLRWQNLMEIPLGFTLTVSVWKNFWGKHKTKKLYSEATTWMKPMINYLLYRITGAMEQFIFFLKLQDEVLNKYYMSTQIITCVICM